LFAPNSRHQVKRLMKGFKTLEKKSWRVGQS
jgi:hypothetical protein